MLKLIYDSTRNADLLYLVRAPIPDKFFYLDTGREQLVFLDQRELGAFRESNRNPSLSAVPLEPIQAAAQRSTGSSLLDELAYHLVSSYGGLSGEVAVPSSFPLDLADSLRGRGVNLVVGNPFVPQRESKDGREVAEIATALKGVYPAYDYIQGVLKAAKIEGEALAYRGQILTSEFLKREIEKIFLDQGLASTEGMIIASGRQAAMPHHPGSGPLGARVPIICDLFPRCNASGYFADMTRTFFKGEPSTEVIRMYRAVAQAQAEAKAATRAGVRASEVYGATVDCFRRLGYPSGGESGFIHGTGHGLGLEIHEEPYLRPGHDEVLREGAVVTIEPGLYFPELGGVRIEDVGVVTADGCQDLTSYPRELTIL